MEQSTYKNQNIGGDVMLSLTNTEIQNQAKKVMQNGGQIVEDTLKCVFCAHPNNQNVEEILAKIVLLDKLYATNLRLSRSNLAKFAENIAKIKDIDIRLQKYDDRLVQEISKASQNRKNLFSFATKYCCLHNYLVYGKDDYSIVDSKVKKNFPKYSKQAQKCGKVSVAITRSQMENWQKQRKHKEINNAIEQLLDAYSINMPYRRRMFDWFLWKQ
ncbi:MAG: hypothetical protein IJX30_00095 [Clostridia bacterium]|nr:hypothetical protein [Clostridia bacterium]